MATLKDVAREAGLSVGTVSRVLNNRGYISDETRESVQRAMARLNYQPNEMARSLSRKKSSMIGVIVPNIDHPYFAKLISCLDASARRQGYEILLFASHGKAEREEEYVRLCSSNRVAGLILCSGDFSTTKLRDLGLPVIAYELFADDSDAAMECDNYEGGVLAAQELIQAGCRKILSISGAGPVNMPADARSEGFLETCRASEGVEAYNRVCKAERIRDLDYMPEINAFLDEFPDADGIFAGSDVIAAMVLKSLRARSRKVPEDVKVLGYDDVMLAELTDPSLTTIHQPVAEMADACMQFISRAAKGESIPVRTTFHVRLTRRESTATG